MLFNSPRKTTNAVLRKAMRTKHLGDRDVLIAHARELNQLALEASGETRPAARRAPTTPVVTPELEAVARRMCLAFHLDWRGDAPTRWGSLVDDQWPDFLVEAQAAIEALLAVSPSGAVDSYLRRAIGGAERSDQDGAASHLR
jgi:hypothetical protein